MSDLTPREAADAIEWIARNPDWPSGITKCVRVLIDHARATADDSLLEDLVRERDRLADIVRRVEHKLGLHLKPGVSDPGPQTSARRVEKWLDATEESTS